MKYEDVKNPNDLYDYMRENIKYGFVSNDDYSVYSRKKINNDRLYEIILFNNYYLQTPKELMISKYGICYDQVELARKWFEEHGYEVKTYFCKYHNHSILTYRDGNSVNWFETTLPGYNGIHKFNTIDELLDFYKAIQLGFSKRKISEIEMYEYFNVIFGCDFYNYIDNITSKSQKILLKK